MLPTPTPNANVGAYPTRESASVASAVNLCCAVEMREDTWQRGDVVLDKYVVEEVIGDGGMGTVVRAVHRELGIPVALKFLKRAWLQQGEVLARFSREARAAVKLKGEHVARVLDVGKTADGVPFMVMEYLEGEDLGTVMKRGPAPLRDAADWIIEACDALGEAHAAEIVHRDIKPENLFLVDRHGRASVKLLDFGVSKMAFRGDPGADELRVTSQMIGTPLYMSPEQVRASKSVDHRVDIWALGAVFYELLAGKPPFSADTLPEVCAMILEDHPEKVSAVRPDLPPEIDRILARCLEKNADHRYQSVTELAVDLLPFAHPRQHGTVEHLTRVQRMAGLSSVQVSSVPPPVLTGRPTLEVVATSLSVTPMSGSTTLIAQPPRRRAWVIGGALSFGLIAAVAVALFFRSQASEGFADAPLPVAPAAAVAPPAHTDESATTNDEADDPPEDDPPAPASASVEALAEAPPPAAVPKPTRARPAAKSKPPATDPPAKTVSAEAPPKPKLEIRLER